MCWQCDIIILPWKKIISIKPYGASKTESLTESFPLFFISFFFYYIFNLCPCWCLIGKDEIVFWNFTLSQCKKSSVKAVRVSLGFRLHLETTSRQNSFPSSGWGERGMGSQVKRRKANLRKKMGKREQVANTHTELFLDIILGKIIKVGLYNFSACRQCAFKVMGSF